MLGGGGGDTDSFRVIEMAVTKNCTMSHGHELTCTICEQLAMEMPWRCVRQKMSKNISMFCSHIGVSIMVWARVKFMSYDVVGDCF